MDIQSFDLLMTALEGLTAEQRCAVADRVKVLGERADSARLIAERVAAPAACAHCASPDVVRFGFAHGQQRMRCKACGKTFTALSGTPFLRLREKEKLLAHAGCMSRGMTVRATAAAVGLTVDRAFRWRHRFLAFLAGQRPSGMTGVRRTRPFSASPTRASARACRVRPRSGAVPRRTRRRASGCRWWSPCSGGCASPRTGCCPTSPPRR